MQKHHLVSAVAVALQVSACSGKGIDATAFTPAKAETPPAEAKRTDYETHDVVPAMHAPPEYVETAKSIGLIMFLPEGEEISAKPLDRVAVRRNGEVVDEDLCDGTSYKGDPTLGPAATVTVVGPDLVLTAKHAVCGLSENTEQKCKDHVAERGDIRIVFGWSFGNAGEPPQADDLEVYEVTEAYATGEGYWLAVPEDDWAILRVNRPIDCKHPSISRARAPAVNDKIFTFAHPFGTPLRYAGCARVREVRSDGLLLETTIDAVDGFSGAPVLALQDGGVAIIGMHTRTQSVVTPGFKVKKVASKWKWPVETTPPPTDDPNDCRFLHGTEVRGAKAAAKYCCDDWRVRVWPDPTGVDAFGCAYGRPPRVLSKVPRGCYTVPTCRDEGCCSARDDSRGVASAGELYESLEAVGKLAHECASSPG